MPERPGSTSSQAALGPCRCLPDPHEGIHGLLRPAVGEDSGREWSRVDREGWQALLPSVLHLHQGHRPVGLLSGTQHLSVPSGQSP